MDEGDSVKLSLDELSAKHGDDDALQVRASQQELRQRQTTDRDRVRVGREQDAQVSRKVSTLIGLDVQGTDGRKVGSIDDLIIDTQSGQIKTAAVKSDGILGLGTRLTSVFCIATTREQADCIAEELKMANFSNNDISVLFPDTRSSRDFAHEKNGKEIYNKVHDNVVDGTKAADHTVHEHPYPVMRIALGVGTIAGFFVSSRYLRNGH